MISGNMARIGTEVEGLSRAADVVGWVEHSSSGHVSFRATTTAAIKLFTTDLHSFSDSAFHGKHPPGVQAALQQLQAMMLSCSWVCSKLKPMEHTHVCFPFSATAWSSRAQEML